MKTMNRILALLLGLSLMAAGCSDPVAPVTPTPATPTVTDTFNGTLLILGSNTHQFTVQQIGGIRVSLTGVTPGASVGIGVGTPSGANCVLIQNLTAVPSPTAQISGNATITGTFCVSVFDVGNLVESVNYIVTVLHS
jgi:hypothetical protein